MPSAGRYIVNGRCSDACTLSFAKLGEVSGRKVHVMYEAGLSDDKMIAAAATFGVKISKGAIHRHGTNHLTDYNDLERDDGLSQLSELEAIDFAIKQGQKSIKNWNMTPSEWKGFVELKHKLTEGTAFDGFVAAVAGASQEANGAQPTRPRADVPSGGVAEPQEPAESLREALPDGRPASGPVRMVGQLDAGYQYAGAGEQVGQDVRDSDEAHRDERVQEGAAPDAREGLDGGAVPDGEYGPIVRPSGAGLQGGEAPDEHGSDEAAGQEVEGDAVPIG